ncbi:MULTISPECIES: FHA domain-containing protein [Clostridium]|uniref:FHA domain-containing protein n=1 Tax=Clostridium TaxID=1485 RepID=UPI0008265068|nr:MULTISPECIES: FHA domain-containing protein [Clostridium]PJI07951.1 FHA domain-containing protein [Clostridium sp. CT7]
MSDYSDIKLSEKTVERKFAVLKIDDTSKIDEKEIFKISSLSKRLIPMEINKKDNSEILYHITGKINLEACLKCRKIRTSEFCNMLLKVIKEATKINSISLQNGVVAVNARFIYVDAKMNEVYFLYIPTGEAEKVDVNEELKVLVKKLIVDVVNIEDNDGFLLGLLNSLRSDKFNDLEEFIRKYAVSEDEVKDKDIDINDIRVSDSEEENTSQETQHNLPTEGININKNSIVKPISEPSELLNPRTEFIMDVKNVKENKPNTYENKIDNDLKDKIKSLKNKTIFQVAAVQVVAAVMIICILILFHDYGALEIFIISCLVGIDIVLTLISVLNFKKKKQKFTVNVHTMNTGNMPVKKESSAANTTNNIKLSKREILTQMSYSTQIIDEKVPYLLSNKNGVVEKIFINKNIFKIGRLTGSVDYVSDNRAIGKMHAEIRKMNSEYYVMDLNSKNGTFINNKRLKSSELYKISENDVIKFANSCYTFKFN